MQTTQKRLELSTSAVTGRRSNQLSHWANIVYLENHIQIIFFPNRLAKDFSFWSSPRPISNSQLHTLLHFHLCPIYLVLFKGSYFF